ncbi:low temperature requirement protein A [Pseudorhodobacter sp.]|uniref:low temperature requirement protein A n=1 Tax=Pseudorhodobacter sp. TaxID=1934400 RepID=UPI002649C36B|nr:low temperature requirement protein A [Pseudorhodobacter sp.]MDN5789065.1 low temperature requirement protein A [Pseudorhodobacter sp.]
MPTTRANPFLRPMPARDQHEPHRTSTQLELLFDLVIVIAIAAAAAGLHHAVAGGHLLEGVLRFIMAFFAIWWAWMNYTWFASAYDNDDTLFRLLTMVIMAGALVMAASIDQLMQHLDLRMPILGYVIMRVAMIALWLRAAFHDPLRRASSLLYAAGIAIVQCYWVTLLFIGPVGETLVYALFVLGAVLELAVPVVAERQGETPWHRHHIMERYGLLTIITLGEVMLAASLALRAALEDHFEIALVHIALSALIIGFSMWSLYFTEDEHLETQSLPRALLWGYGHSVLFASVAAVGAGFAVLVDVVTGHAAISLLGGDYAVAVPLVLYLLILWLVRDRYCLQGPSRFVLPGFAVLALAMPALGLGLEGVAAALVGAVIARSFARKLNA